LIKKDIKFENPFTEETVTEEHYFHISKADLVEMELEEHNNTYERDGETLTGMQAKLQRIIDSNDGRAIITEFKDIIRRAYGKKEGERFIKSREIQDDFLATEAFSQLLFELCTQPDAAGEFINGVVPGNLNQIAAEVAEQAARVSAGREAQAQAKAAGGHPSDSAATPVEELTAPAPDSSRSREIANATSENPVTLTQAEVTDLDGDVLKSGLADGRYKLG
jgi:hypothetical protein